MSRRIGWRKKTHKRSQMAKTKWIQNPDPDSFGNLTGKVKLTTYLNGVRNGETYINTQDSDIHYEVERLTDRGYKVKILHEVCSKSQTPLY